MYDYFASRDIVGKIGFVEVVTLAGSNAVKTDYRIVILGVVDSEIIAWKINHQLPKPYCRESLPHFTQQLEIRMIAVVEARIIFAHWLATGLVIE